MISSVPMDLRTLPEGLSPRERCDERRKRVEAELGVDLSVLSTSQPIGSADEQNCEQMIGAIPLPVGYAGPLSVHFSSGDALSIHLPLATTEAALVASVNRGCRAIGEAGGAHTSSNRVGITRSIALRSDTPDELSKKLKESAAEWTTVAEATSGHLKILSHDINVLEDYVFLTIAADTDEAMGMNMVTIASDAVGKWAVEHIPGTTFVTVAANVDSDKKPSKRTAEKGRGFIAEASVTLRESVIRDILKSDPQLMLQVAHAKLDLGSTVAGALGKNLHAANIIAALYLATGQDAAHVVEGSLATTTVEADGSGLRVSVRLPAVLVGVRGGGTSLPAQAACLSLLLGGGAGLHPSIQLAESVAAAVLAGEVSLLAAQASHSLASAHKKLARKTS